MNLIRGSEVNDYLRCRKRWKYRWIDRLEAMKPNGKLFFGNLFHKFVQEYYNHKSRSDAESYAYVEMQKLFRETDTKLMEQTELDELWDLVEHVTENYVKQWQEYDKDIKVIATELRFAITLDDDTMYEGTIDMVYLKDGKLYFKDYKTAASIERYRDKAEMDRQISRYWWALQQLARGNGYILSTISNDWVQIRYTDLWHKIGETEPSGFIYDIVLKDYPTPPKRLKPTKNVPVALSVAKNQLTTFDVYLHALNEAGLIDCSDPDKRGTDRIPEDYREILDHLKAQETEYGNRFFQRIPVSRLQPEIDAAMDEFYAVALEAHELKRSVNFNNSKAESRCYRNINDDCHWDCEFKMLCVAEMDGSNAGMIKNLAYKQKEVEATTWQSI